MVCIQILYEVQRKGVFNVVKIKQVFRVYYKINLMLFHKMKYPKQYLY